MLLSLMLPVALCAVALFFASFLSWMIVKLHEADWKKLPREEEFMNVTRPLDIPQGNYMFPRPLTTAEMQSEEFKKKYEAGPRGTMTILPKTNMGANLGLTFLYFFVVSFVLAYLGEMALKPGSDFLTVFRFFFAAGLLAFLASIVQHSIWFRVRVVGHLIESVFYAAIVGAIFGAMWPSM